MRQTKLANNSNKHIRATKLKMSKTRQAYTIKEVYEAVDKCNGDKTQASLMLGMSRFYCRKRIYRHEHGKHVTF